jgi:hypothetical protein
MPAQAHNPARRFLRDGMLFAGALLDGFVKAWLEFESSRVPDGCSVSMAISGLTRLAGTTAGRYEPSVW